MDKCNSNKHLEAKDKLTEAYNNSSNELYQLYNGDTSNERYIETAKDLEQIYRLKLLSLDIYYFEG